MRLLTPFPRPSTRVFFLAFIFGWVDTATGLRRSRCRQDRLPSRKGWGWCLSVDASTQWRVCCPSERSRAEARRVPSQVAVTTRHRLSPSECRSGCCAPPSTRAFRVPKSCDPTLRFSVVLGKGHQDTNAPHPLGLLRARSERPHNGCAAEKRDELASPHPGPKDSPSESFT